MDSVASLLAPPFLKVDFLKVEKVDLEKLTNLVVQNRQLDQVVGLVLSIRMQSDQEELFHLLVVLALN